MSRCYLNFKITFVPVEAESEAFLSQMSPVSSENGMPEKSWSQTHYTTAEEAQFYEGSLPSYEQIHVKVADSGEAPGVQSAPLLLQSQLAPGGIQPSIQAKVEVHRNLESDEERRAKPALNADALTISRPERAAGAPLASLPEDTDTSASEEAQSVAGSPSPAAGRRPETAGAPRLAGGPPCYDDIALIDAQPYEGLWSSKGEAGFPAQTRPPAAAVPTAQGGFFPTPVPGLLRPEGTDKAEEEEDDFYYGLKEEPEQFLLADESDLEQ
ncbi:barttin isoform X2 [Rhinatrema bivittatum]|uniref:barttin isoform X2 n=1 Tax=Rhinatrema bivittatum TaxID=194408 RepID=UPI0011289A1C|nr:barttin isoform X2 [Rhinatrema bivittatum]